MSRIWTDAEIDFLHANWETMEDNEIAYHLNRSRNGVSKQRKKLNLVKIDTSGRPPRKVTIPQQINTTFCAHTANRQLIIDWFRVHGDRGYGDSPVNFRSILEFYQERAA